MSYNDTVIFTEKKSICFPYLSKVSKKENVVCVMYMQVRKEMLKRGWIDQQMS